MQHFFRIVLISFFILSLSNNVIAQQEDRKLFISDINSNWIGKKDTSKSFKMHKPVISDLQKEDKIADKRKDVAWRFGVEEKVQLDLMKEMSFHSINQSEVKGVYHIEADGAYSINLNFSKFILSKSARLYVFNKNQTDFIGAINAQNNKVDSLFSIRPIEGEEIFIELILNQSELNQNKLELSGLVYGYRSLREKAGKGFGSSGNCNVNANCKAGDDWADVKRSIAMILTSNNTRVCTGTLINNVRQDSTPYLLTANHCGLANNSIFIFDYRSATCSPNTDGSLVKSISGASHRASSTVSDFKLFQLSQTPPPSFKVFYSGWDARDIVSPRSTVIHHPSGDVMKISIDEDSTMTSGYYNTTDTTYWTVGNWELGTTEGGSSGSSLFNSYQRIIGQLHGGQAACGNNAQDYFGKFSVSWDALASSNQQLKFWLDPDNTGTTVLDGLDLDTSNSVTDVAIIGVNGVPALLCDSLLNPRVILRNNGQDTIYAINLNYRINNSSVQSSPWVGQLFPKQVIEVPFNLFTLQNGKSNIEVWQQVISSVDQVAPNDSISFTTMASPLPLSVTFTLKTDDYGDETSWEIFEQGSNYRLSSGGPYEQINGGKIYTKTLCLYDSCFSLNLSDAIGDGFNDPSGNFGNGYALIQNLRGDTLLFENNFTGSSKNISFCVRPTSNSLNEKQAKKINYYPNPVSSGEEIYVQEESLAYFEVYSIAGKLIGAGKMDNFAIKMPDKSGMYIIVIRNASNEVQGRLKIVVQ